MIHFISMESCTNAMRTLVQMEVCTVRSDFAPDHDAAMMLCVHVLSLKPDGSEDTGDATNIS